MVEIVQQLKQFLNSTESYFVNADENTITFKASIHIWSKKEILGHLIDSGINNLQRFTEIHFKEKPYKVSSYNQDKLVISNHYQEADLVELLGFWISINERIINVIQHQTEESLSQEIEIDGEFNNLQFLMTDYVAHLKHHVNQIVN